MPQLSVSSPTVTEAISRTEDAINAIMTGRVAGFAPTKKGGGMNPTNQLYVSLTAVVIATAAGTLIAFWHGEPSPPMQDRVVS